MTNNRENIEFGLQAVAPYTHPQHWDNHTFGQGELTAPLMLIGDTPQSAIAFSRQTLLRFFNHLGPRYTLQTFRPSQTFEAESYTEGTILAFRQEGLYTVKARKAKRLLNGFESEPPIINNGLPPHTKDFAPHCLTVQDERKLASNGIINYWNKAIWGVVTADKKGDPLIVRTPPAFIDFWPDKVTVGSSTSRLEPIVQIGKVEHIRRGRYERLSRVHMLEVCAYGQAQTQRKPFGFSHLVHRPAEGTA